MDLESRVRAGATMLDAEVPGWWARIDIATLELASCTECILGQLFGDYIEAPAQLRYGGPTGSGTDFGFVDETFAGSARYRQLRQLWISQILRRRRDADDPVTG